MIDNLTQRCLNQLMTCGGLTLLIVLLQHLIRSWLNSCFSELGSETVDSFTTDWGEENNWCCPLLCLVPRMIQTEFGCQTGHKVFAPCGAGPHLGGGCLDLIVPCSSLVAGQVLVGICGCWFKKCIC